jgi:hypothetical protein
MAEAVRFELTERCRPLVFKTSALSLSATLPKFCYGYAFPVSPRNELSTLSLCFILCLVTVLVSGSGKHLC